MGVIKEIIPINSDILILNSETKQFLSKSYDGQFQDNFQNFLEFLSTINRGHYKFLAFKYLGLNYDRSRNSLGLSFSKDGVLLSLCNHLNCLNRDLNVSNIENNIEGRLNILRNIKSESELREEFPFLYYELYTKFKANSNNDASRANMILYNKLMKGKDLFQQKMIEAQLDKRMVKQVHLDKLGQDLSYFVKESFKYLRYLSNHIGDVSEWIDNNPIRLSLSNSDQEKLLLYIMERQINSINGNKELYAKQKGLILLESMMSIYEKKYVYSNCTIRFNRTNTLSKEKKEIIINYEEIKKMYEKIIKENKSLKAKSLGEFDYRKMTNEELSSAIDRIINNLQNSLERFKKIQPEEASAKINKVISNTEVTEENLSKINMLKRKIEFLLNHKPKYLIEGTETFRNYIGYVYPSGIVVFDYICGDAVKSYGKAIYVIPIDKLEKYSALSLSVIKKFKDEVKAISHSSDWESRLETVLSSYEKKEEFTFDVINQIDMASTLEDLKKIREELLGLNEEIEKLIAAKEYQLLKKQFIDKINAATTIEELESIINSLTISDDEINKLVEEKLALLKQIKEIEETPAAEDLTTSEIDDLKNAEEDLLDKCGENRDFTSLCEEAKKTTTRVRRNPAVSLLTKLRTMDEDGYMHCDLCDNDYTNCSTRMFEAHHIIPIAQGGVDNLYNTACLCPNCHTRIHNYLRIKKSIDALDKDPTITLKRSAMGEYMTLSEYGSLLERVRSRIASSTPEYLSFFDRLFSSNYRDDKGLSDEELLELYKEEEKLYSENKKEYQRKFSIEWNTPIKKRQ